MGFTTDDRTVMRQFNGTPNVMRGIVKHLLCVQSGWRQFMLLLVLLPR